MNAHLRLKEVYPIALLVILLMTWALVDSTNSAEAVQSLQWSQLRKVPEAKDSCKDHLWLNPNNPFCEAPQPVGSISTLFQNHDFSRLLSVGERKNQMGKNIN